MPTPDQTDATTPDPPREFSDGAVLRGALAAAVAAYFLPILVAPLVMSGDPILALQAWPYVLGVILRFETLFIGLLLTSALSIVGLIFLVRDKRGHTTYAAAARAGASTAAFVIVLASAVFTLPYIAAGLFTGIFNLPELDLAVIMRFIGSSMGAIAVGALSGLAGRLAAGAPRTMPAPEPT